MGMNDNAPLYKQTQKYSRTGGPYQALTLPWWVRTPQPTYPPRHRCSIEAMNCGEKVFGEIAVDISAATRSIDLISWGFDPGMVLLRNSDGLGKRFGDLLIEIASREQPVSVRLLIWHDDNLSQRQMRNVPGYYGTRHPAIGSSVKGFLPESHQNYNAEWFEQIRDGVHKNICLHVRSMASKWVASALRNENPPSSVMAMIAKLYPTHHQKMLLIDYELPEKALGYVMGHNCVTDFWDSEAHLFQDPRRETVYRKDPALAWKEGPNFDRGDAGFSGWVQQPSEHMLKIKEEAVAAYLKKHAYKAMPYQDVSTRLRGPILYDLNHNFCQAWSESVRPSSIQFDAMAVCARTVKKVLSGPFEAVIDAVADAVFTGYDDDFIAAPSHLKPASFHAPGRTQSVQLLRTQPMHSEKAIKECYANLTRQMQHYIFIQNQYLQYENWAEHLIACVKRLRAAGFLKPVYVFLLTSTPEDAGMDLPTYEMAEQLGQSETMVVEHAEAVAKAQELKTQGPISPDKLAEAGIHVFMGSLWTSAKEPKSDRDYEEIYIHAKVGIVDDAAFTVGSANLNVRSMAIDSELNVLSDSAEAAYSLRCSLFQQVALSNGPAKFGDMPEAYQKFRDIAENNRVLRTARKCLFGQLLPFHVNRQPGRPIL